MVKFIAAMVYIGSLLPLYLEWSRHQVEGQIDRMQSAVFNSPGAEAPITPAVVLGGITLLTSHMVVARRILALSLTAAFFSMVAGGMVGYWGWQRLFADHYPLTNNRGESQQ